MCVRERVCDLFRCCDDGMCGDKGLILDRRIRCANLEYLIQTSIKNLQLVIESNDLIFLK